MLRRLKKFDYAEARSIEEALSLLEEHGPAGKVLAGGTDLLVHMKKGKCVPSGLIDIKPVKGLEGISFEDEGGLVLGALTTVRTIEDSPRIAGTFPLLWEAARGLGSKQVRNRATVGGNLCNASPAADLSPALIAYGAVAALAGRTGQRELLLEDFFRGPGLTALAGDEILAQIRIPPPPPDAWGCYIKHTVRRSVELAIVGVAVLLHLSDDHLCRKARVVLGAVAPTPIRAGRSEALLRGKRLGEELLREAAKAAAEEASPIADQRASAEYRREMISVLVRRALASALAEGEGKREGRGR